VPLRERWHTPGPLVGVFPSIESAIARAASAIAVASASFAAATAIASASAVATSSGL
jgi:hypothetical protein